jgi:hypothetical protein
MNKSESVIYVDIDDTLIRTVGAKRIPMPHVVKRVQELAAASNVLYAWSSGGEGYAREVTVELGIDSCFTAFLPKPKIMIDDQSPADWRYLKVMHPNELL